jgi:hypothetical protein
MRDYKQMKEVQKLREQAAAEGESDLPETDESKKYSKRSPGFGGWMEYIVEYYKWPILFGVVLVSAIIFAISQTASTSNPDLSMMYVGPFYMSPAEQDKLGETVAMLSGDKEGDYNQDGHFRYDFLDLTISHIRDQEGIEYTYDDQNAAYTRFQTEMRAGDTVLYFLEPYFYRVALSEGIIAPLSELGIDTSFSYDGYGIPIGNLDCYELDGFSKMPAEAIVCLRKSPDSDAISYGRTQESWEDHKDLFLQMVNYRSADRVIDTQTSPDITLLYVGEEPVYKSVRLPVESLLNRLAADTNGDGKTRCNLHALTRSGSALPAAILTKQIRTELVTGKEFLMLLDESAYQYAKEHDLLAELPDELKDTVGAADGVAIRFNSLALRNEEGFCDLEAISYLCLRKAPADGTENYGRTEAEYQAALELFLRLAMYEE